ncbi:hypothetical protein GCM10023091_34910 [Ravibacter arvi]|uniref:Methyltransferase n=1 Tax=Ravibacter arvi TaxID=2051041 RepID=A0ABP8M799_9BACT
MAFLKIIIATALIGYFLLSPAYAQEKSRDRDERVKKFLKENRQKWQDLNVPYEDGKVLHDLIVARNYRSALEIGTSTGHSTVWIAWALSKTGGKLVTLEIDPERQKTAIENVKKAGLSEFVDFRLGDAHTLAKEVKGPLDFVFSDADKGWYTQYFKDLSPKMSKGGTFTAHNVLQNISGIREFLEFVKSRPDYDTSIDRTSSSGISMSTKK